MFGLSTAGALAIFYVVASILASLFVLTACVVSSQAKRKGEQLFQAAHLAKEQAKLAALDAKVATAAKHRRPVTIVVNHRNSAYDENRTEQTENDEVVHRNEVIQSVMDVFAEVDASPERSKMPVR